VWYRTTWFAFLVVVACLAVVVAILVVPVWATSTNKYCSSCKATRQAALELKTTAHGRHGVTCTACHASPGLTNQIKWRGHEWLNVWADYLNMQRKPTKGHVPSNASCIQCHKLSTLPAQGAGVRFSHTAHMGMHNLACVDCHGDVAHPKPGENPNQVSMTVCTMCHNQQGAPNTCSTCHTTSVAKQDVHPSDYLKTHGIQAVQDEAACLRCHDKTSFCDACHANPTPAHFSGTWAFTHGATAQKDEAVCLGCHNKQTFCDQCHAVAHPSDWATTHGAVAASSGTAACLVCHQQLECQRCHQQKGVTS
jgi:nitrate/TMAO reductase-like tetraheme cytochrome c subunit